MIKQHLGMICCLLLGVFSSYAQTFTESRKIYPLSTDGNQYVVSGFTPFPHQKDEEIYANALLWTIENICPKLREGIVEVNVPAEKLYLRSYIGFPSRFKSKKYLLLSSYFSSSRWKTYLLSLQYLDRSSPVVNEKSYSYGKIIS